MNVLKNTLAGLALLASTASMSSPEDDVRASANLWIEGIAKGDPDYMVSMYDTDAILHGTVSPVLRRGPELIREYFAGSPDSISMFFIEPMHIRVFDDIAVNTGNYAVRLGVDAEPVTMRYSFVYRKVANEWKIIDHHSSNMPE